MDKPKLNFRFHNPNTPEEFTKILLRTCIDANMKRVEQILREEAESAINENIIGAEDEHCSVLQSVDRQGRPA